MPLTANRELNRYVDQELRTFPVAAGAHLFKGAFIGVERATGFARHLVAGDLFAGIAYEEADNTAGASGGELSVRVYTQGDFSLPVNNASQAWAGAPVFAMDNQTTSVASQLGGSFIGALIAITGTNQGIVRLQPLATPAVELTAHVPLLSSTSGATTNPVLITQRAIKVTSAQVAFNTVPDAGNLDVGTDNTNPTQLVNAFILSTLTAHVPANLNLVGRDVAKAARVWARVGQATSSAGAGGILTVRYFELP
jgi:hypothetical protein